MSLRDLYSEYHDRVEFLVVYIREAHPTDGWYVGNHDIRDPQSIEERRKVAGMCKEAMKHGIRTYVDEMDDAVMTAYVARPERLYLVDVDGRVTYVGERGPWGFHPKELKEAIVTLLAAKTVGVNQD